MQIQHNDVSLYVQTFGSQDNPALIFSNSLGTTYQMWQPQIDALQNDYFIITYDTRGHGQSSAPSGTYSLADLGGDVIAILDQLNIKKALFCGISMGGLTGQWLAIHHPKRFYHMMLCNTAAKIGQKDAWQSRADLVRKDGLAPIAETASERWFTPNFIATHPDIVQKLSNTLAKGSAEGYANCCEALAGADLREQLNQITIPVTVVAGSADPVTTVEDGKFMTDSIAHSTLALIDASHISNIEQPEAFNQFILQHLKC